MSYKLNLITKYVTTDAFVIQSSKDCLLCLFTGFLTLFNPVDSWFPDREAFYPLALWQALFFFFVSPSCVTTSS